MVRTINARVNGPRKSRVRPPGPVPFIVLAALVLAAAYVAIKTNETPYWDTPAAQWFHRPAPPGAATGTAGGTGQC